MVIGFAATMLDCFLPALGQLLSVPAVEVRLSCLRILSDVTSTLLGLLSPWRYRRVEVVRDALALPGAGRAVWVRTKV